MSSRPELLALTQKKASYFIISVVMWEFFSYFGMQALLILYLTQKLAFNDTAAYDLYGNFTSLIFITPVIGGYLADKYCGYRYAVMWGCLLIIAGHVLLGTLTTQGLYVGLSFLIVGIGLFKSNAICLIGKCYPHDPAGKSAAFSWYYVSGNLGAIASQLLCPYLAQTVSWHLGFVVAAFGMLMGFVMLCLSKRYFSWEKETILNHTWHVFSNAKQLVLSVVMIVIALLAAYVAMVCSLVGYLLIVICVLSLVLCYNIYRRADRVHQRSLITIALLTVFATAFWVFDQQGTSSFSLFIARFVNRDVAGFVIPAGMFQAINPSIILITGVVMAFVWRALDRRGIKPRAVSKLMVALVLLALGFYLIARASELASQYQLAAMVLPVMSLVVIGAAELFVDPVLLTAMGEAAPKQSIGQLVAIYYLAVGAIANYVAAMVAKLTIDPSTQTATALTYHAAYLQMFYVVLAMLCILVCVQRVLKRS